MNKAGAVSLSSLGSCTGKEGTLAAISDSSSTLGGAVITGGGTNHVAAYCDGTNWTVTGSTVQTGSVNAQTSTYAVVAADFANNKTISVASGTFTITLVASGSQPPTGQSVKIINYGSGVVTIARNLQNINGGTSPLILPASSATAPTSSTVTSDGTDYVATLSGGTSGGGGGGGASATYQLTDLSVARTSSTILTIGAGCTVSTPCNVSFNGTPITITASATVTHSGSTSDTARIYVTSAGTITAQYNTTADATCSGCSTVAGTSFPANVFQLYTWTSTSGTWDSSGGVDKRAAYGVKALTAGTGVIVTPGSTADTIAADTAVLATYLTGTSSLTFGSVATGACSTDQTFTLTGATTGKSVSLGLPSTFPAGFLANAFVSAADTIKVRVCNSSGSSGGVSASTYRATVINP